MKAVKFHPKAREAIRSFPADVRSKIGQVLYFIQIGYSVSMPHVRPMPTVAAGVYEVRASGAQGAYRVLYLIIKDEYVFVFHAFMKKTRKTSLLEIQLVQKRLKGAFDGQS